MKTINNTSGADVDVTVLVDNVSTQTTLHPGDTAEVGDDNTDAQKIIDEAVKKTPQVVVSPKGVTNG